MRKFVPLFDMEDDAFEDFFNFNRRPIRRRSQSVEPKVEYKEPAKQRRILYKINTSLCNREEKEEVTQLLESYRRLTKNAPKWYQPDYYTLLAGYPVEIEVVDG